MPDTPLTAFFARTRPARKIIVVDFGFLGDTIHLVPVLWEIKRHYPQAELHVLTTPVGSEVLQLVSCVQRAWPLEMQRATRTLRAQWRCWRALRRERFDLALNFNWSDRTLIWTALVGAPWRAAQAGGRRHFWRSWLIPHWLPRQSAELPVFDQRRLALAAGGFDLAPVRWDLRPPAEARRKAELVVPLGAIHLSICASSPLKEWPLANWVALTKRLLAGNPQLRIVATGSRQPREQTQVQALAQQVASDRLTPLLGLTIAELTAALGRCCLHVGADSGVLHLAVAVGRPTISLFRDYHDASAWRPVGAAHRSFSAPCVCVNQPEPPCAARNRPDCLARIEVATIEQAVRQQLASVSPPAPNHDGDATGHNPQPQ